jgi:hypothetical protein
VGLSLVACSFHALVLSDYCVFVSGSLIASKTKKQVAVSHSSVEPELHAMALVKEFPSVESGQASCNQNSILLSTGPSNYEISILYKTTACL